MRVFVSAVFLVIGVSSAFAQESIKIAELKQSPPAALGAEVRGALLENGFRISDQEGKPFADLWLRKAIPGLQKPAGPMGAVQFPFLAEGELLGAVQFASEGHDYRDQPIARGVYTIRYGLQPVNGDHLGVSTYRDYSLLLPAAKDKSLAPPAKKQLEERSAESAGTSHPAVFLLLEAPTDASKTAASTVHDAEKNTWSVVVPLPLKIKDQSESMPFPVRLIVVGAAAA